MPVEPFESRRPFLVGIDSDGCAFDTMELKHKECFIPQIINHYELQAVSKYVRETAEFINLYSSHRGINRFSGLVLTLEMLQRRPEVRARGVKIEVPASLKQWTASGATLSNPSLAAQVKATGDADLAKCLAWSEGVNAAIANMVRHVPPFPYVGECLDRLHAEADLLVVSATPAAALKAEWAEHRLDGRVSAIFGQESGSKHEILAVASRYKPGNALMVGDAPGDLRASAANGCLFFPIEPGQEEASWELLFREGLDRFLRGTFAGEFERGLQVRFSQRLAEHPPWRELPE